MPNVFYDFDMAMFEMESCFVQYPIPAAGTGVTQAETSVGIMGPGTLPISIGFSVYHNGAAVTPSNTNYSVMNVFKRTGTGGAVLLAQLNNSVSVAPFNPGSWAAFLPVNMAVQAGSGSFVSPSDVVTFSVTNGAGTGLAFPQGIVGLFAKYQ